MQPIRLRRSPVFAAAAFLTAAAALARCSSSALPAAIAQAGWSDVRVSDRNEVRALLARMSADALAAEGRFIFRAVVGDTPVPVMVNRADGWTSVVLDGDIRLWEDRLAGTPQKPVTVWARDVVTGESERDMVLCSQGRCTDVSAWYQLAPYHEIAPLPATVAGLAPQEVFLAALIGSLDPSLVAYHLDTIDEELRGGLSTSDGLLSYTLADRVYVLGHRSGTTGRQTCVGWFNHREELESAEDRFVRFCHDPASRTVLVGNGDELLEYEPWDPAVPHRPVVQEDLYMLVEPEVREYLEVFGDVDDGWARRHSRV